MTLRIFRPPFCLRSGHDILGQKTEDMFSSRGIKCEARDLWPELPSALMHARVIPFGIRLFSKFMAPIFASYAMRKIMPGDIFWVLGQAVPRQTSPIYERSYQAKGARYIFHIMDDWLEIDFLRQATINRANIADLIVVPTPALLEKIKYEFPNKKVVKLEEPIDVDRFNPVLKCSKKNSNPPVIVWSGNPGNLILLQSIIKTLSTLSTRNSFILRIISNRRPDFNLPFNWEWKKYDYYNESNLLAGSLAGLAPINDTTHDRAKGVYKVKTYLAAGIPPVGPPIGYLNQLIDNNQNGFLCRTESEWVECLSLLLSDPIECNRLSLNARQSALEKYSHNSVADQWVNEIKTHFSLTS